MTKKTKVLILGIDGYIGWALAQQLASNNYDVVGIDNFSRRTNVEKMGSWSALPIYFMEERLKAFEEIFKKKVVFQEGDLTNYRFIENTLRSHKPDAIVHLGEQPSAPFSMIDIEHAAYTQENNVIGTLNLIFAMRKVCPKAHLLKLATMGEYGVPNVDIPEGFFEVEYRGRKDFMPFPKRPGSFYHLSKCHDSLNIEFACRIWNLRSTNIMQGVVYGTRTDEIIDNRLYTRFDFDGVFGTALNRYCAQAVIGHRLTPYGSGHQKRGFIALRDSLQCLRLAIDNPPDSGEYRVFNQFDEVYNVTELARKVKSAAGKMGLHCEIGKLKNPRIEAESHYYKPDSEKLRKLGFRPTHKLKDELKIMLTDLLFYKKRIEAKSDSIMPKVLWGKGYG